MTFYRGWYAAIASDEVKGNRPHAFRRFGQDVVVWRDSKGNPIVMHDLCPHRSVKLSLGTVKNDCIACPFHGFEYGSDGACLLVPETSKPAPNLKCETVPCYEKHGFIWLWYGPGEEPSAPHQWFDELDEGLAWCQFQSEWPCHLTRCVENQLDYAHLPYVHGNTIGANFDVTSAKHQFELSEQGIKATMDKAYFWFKFPNIWSLQIVPGKFYQFIAFVPIETDRTLLYVRAYQRFATAPGIKQLLGLVLNFQSQKILRQDHRVVISHPRHASPLDTNEKLYPSDKGVAWFRKCWSEGVYNRST